MGQDKALLRWAQGTFLSGAIALLQPHTELVIVVGGSNAEALAPVVYAQGASLVRNRHPERGQFSSLQLGLQEVLNLGRDAAIVALVDRPPALPKTVAQLKQAFLAAVESEKWAAVPEHEGKHGHPIIAGRELIEAFLRAPVDSTARDVEHAHHERIAYVPVSDPHVTMNADTPEDYQRLSTERTRG